MMRRLATPLLVLLAVLIGCFWDDNEYPRIVDVQVEPSALPAGGVATVTVTTSHFQLVGDDGEHNDGHGDNPNVGHFHIYLDNLLDTPLAMPHTETFEVTIPDGTAAGTHQLIVRLQHASHEIIEPQVISAAPVTVE